MGISTIIRWQSVDNSVPTLDLLRDRLERNFGAKLLGKWQLNCRVYHPVRGVGGMAQLYVVSSTEEGGRVWLLGKEGIIEGNRELEGVVHRLRSLWSVRQSAGVEGWSYAIGDFIIRVGNASVGTASKGIVLMAEYVPSVSLEAQLDGGLLGEFIDQILPPGSVVVETRDAEADQRALGEIGLGQSPWTSRHGGWQYVSFFLKHKML